MVAVPVLTLLCGLLVFGVMRRYPSVLRRIWSTGIYASIAAYNYERSDSNQELTKQCNKGLLDGESSFNIRRYLLGSSDNIVILSNSPGSEIIVSDAAAVSESIERLSTITMRPMRATWQSPLPTILPTFPRVVHDTEISVPAAVNPTSNSTLAGSDGCTAEDSGIGTKERSKRSLRRSRSRRVDRLPSYVEVVANRVAKSQGV